MTADARRADWPAAWWHRVLLVIAGLIIWTVAIDVPWPPSAGLDQSWQSALVDAHLHGRQFGTGLVFTAGPWGWLTSNFFLPDAIGIKLAWEVLGKLLCAVVVVVISLRLPLGRRWFLLLALPLWTGIFPDTLFTVVITLAVLFWLFDRNAPAWLATAVIVLLALLAQVKFTYTVLAGAGVVLATASLAWQGAVRRAVACLVGYTVAHALWWLAAGQNLANLPHSVYYALEIAGSYPAAMSVECTWDVFLAGLAVLATGLGFAWQIARRHSDRRWAWPAAVFLALTWYLVWKHGFVRADGHVFALFLFALLLAPTLPPLFFPERRFALIDLCVPLCVLGIAVSDAGKFSFAPRLTEARFRSGLRTVFRPDRALARFQTEWDRATATEPLAAVQKLVGNETIDFFTHGIGDAFLQGFTYHPRPVLQSYQAYTAELQKLNRRFFQSSDAPQFVLFRHGTIDGRFPTQDDALTMAELPRRYDVAHATPDYTLLRHRETQPLDRGFRIEPMEERSPAWGEEIPLPLERGHALWMQVRLYPTRLIGRWRSRLYKPPQAMMVVTDDTGRQTRHRVIAPIARQGFIIQPFLETQDDWNQFLGGHGRQWLRSIRFEPRTPDEAEFWAGVGVKFFRLPDLPLDTVDPMAGYVEGGFTNLAPQRVWSGVATQAMEVAGRRSLQVHAPGEIEFVPGAERCLEGWFGLGEGSYTGAGKTSGADFSVEAEFADGHRETIWQRRLQPLHVADDRGPQRISVTIPGDATRVIVRTGAGPEDNTNWDWTYWSELRFSDCAQP